METENNMLTHSSKGGNYTLKLWGKPLPGHANHATKGWYWHEPTQSGESFKFDTMAQLKAWVWSKLTDEQKKEPEKVVRQSKPKVLYSHTGSRVYIAEAMKVWPHFRFQAGALSAYLTRKYHESVVKWGGPCATWAQRWLDENKDVGVYDEAEELRRLEKLYPGKCTA